MLYGLHKKLNTAFRLDEVDEECAWNKYCQRLSTVSDIKFYLDSHFDNPEYNQVKLFLLIVI